MSERRFDVIVVGAGAAGLMAAIAARRRARELGVGLSIVALDGAPRIGAKIIISGGGRCNVTHEAVTAADFNGGSANVIARILRTFPVDQTIAFFRDLGVFLKREETGKLFPVTDRARTVLDPLVREAGDVRPGNRVVSVQALSDGFRVHTQAEQFVASTLIIATGGRSVPKTGSDGFGYSLVRALGHSVGETIPALVSMLLPAGHWLTGLSGLSTEVELMLRDSRGRMLRRHRGPMLLTHFGLSGPVVLDMSRHWIAAEGPDLRMNLMPERTFREVEALLQSRPSASVATILSSLLPDRLVSGILEREVGVGAETRAGALTREARRRIAHALTEMALPVTGDRGFGYAEVTAGGVPLDEIDPRTMESRRCANLFLCGEILDVDGRIGGFNFQWAWASGRLAGRSGAEAAVRLAKGD